MRLGNFILAVLLLVPYIFGSGGPVVEFRLYTHWNWNQTNRIMPHKPTKEELHKKNFECHNGTVVLFYEWKENPFERHEFEHFARDMAIKSYRNVIIPNYYKTITAHFNQIPDVISNFIVHLANVTNCAYDNFEFFSDHSGVHIAAIVGEKLQGKIKRIVGLNPYSPNHTDIRPSRIRPSHAKFVEIYISQNRYPCSQRTGEACGHVNIILNGGDSQPGCKTSFYFQDVFACSVFRAFEVFSEAYFRDSTLSKVLAYVCPSYDKFIKNECKECSTNGTDCFMMGEKQKEIFEMQAKLPPRWFYLNTKSTKPYIS